MIDLVVGSYQFERFTLGKWILSIGRVVIVFILVWTLAAGRSHFHVKPNDHQFRDARLGLRLKRWYLSRPELLQQCH